MIRRIEIAWPILGAQMQMRILQECIEPYLKDTEDAWVLMPTADYKQVSSNKTNTQSAQKLLIARYS
jgi:polyphosphate kinase